MFNRINEDIKTAMKAKDKGRLDAIRYLKAMLIENKVSKSPKPELDVVVSYVKKLKDSIGLFPEGSDQRAKTELEITFLTPYMPEELKEEGVANLIKEIIQGLDNPNMGMVMKELSPKIKGRFDGKKASQMVIAALKS
ncbi:MAG: GatB/YqeY domain-containing protein [Epsilonproteobacteria bacterium]|nr:MAG: GatB/YqeY domain-containing protein [Campylobacterota bacterium]RLA66313.1 MAG: GatB/YqeY domain-containing protein [Campylobacterota bacterium]